MEVHVPLVYRAVDWLVVGALCSGNIDRYIRTGTDL